MINRPVSIERAFAGSGPLVVVTGGGSGGHTMPALAVVDYLQRTQYSRVAYIGSRNGLERAAATHAGIPYFAISTGKLRRARHWVGLLTWKNVRDIASVLAGLCQSLIFLRSLKPAAVLGTGGFVSVPVVWAARLLGIPVLVHEQTLQFGLANRLAAPAATCIALSTELSLDALRPSWRQKAIVTGNPVRVRVLQGDAGRAIERFGLQTHVPTIFVTGGGQGAEVINRAIHDALPDLLMTCNIIHQCGAGKGLTTTRTVLSERKARIERNVAGNYWVAEFLDEDAMGDAYTASTLVVSRSGAGTTNELAATGTPALLVPLVPTSGDEQRRIAKHFEAAGAAVVVASSEFTGRKLLEEIRTLFAEPNRLAEMRTAISNLSTAADATQNLAEALLRIARA